MSSTVRANRLWGAVGILRYPHAPSRKRACAANTLIWLSFDHATSRIIRERASAAMLEHFGVAIVSDLPAAATGAGNEAS